MNISLELIIGIFEVVCSVILPYFFENNLWSKDLPKTIELFNKEYESKINRILVNNTNKSSELLESIINNNIHLTDESDSEEYTKLLKLHAQLLIEIRRHVDIEEMHKTIELLYQNLFDINKNIKNVTGIVIVFYFVCVIIWWVGYFDKFQVLIQSGIFCLTFYSLVRVGELYFKFKSDWNKILSHKKWILDNDKNIPRIIDNNIDN